MEITKKPKAIYGHLMVLATILIYSFNTNFMKTLMPEWIGPQGLILLRCLVSCAGFWLIDLFVSSSGTEKPNLKDIGMMMLGGALGMGGNLLLYITGLALTGPIDAFVIRTVQPIIVVGIAVVFLHSAFTRYKAWGIAFGLAGALYASLMPHAGVVKDSFGGDALIFGAAVASALFLILINPYIQKFNSIYVMKWMSLAAVILTFPFGIKQLINASVFTGQAGAYVWFELSYTLLLATMLGYFLNVRSLKYISPFVSSVYIYLLPVTGSAVSILLGLQKFSWHDPVALVLIVIGFVLINKSSGSKNTHPVSAVG